MERGATRAGAVDHLEDVLRVRDGMRPVLQQPEHRLPTRVAGACQ